MKQDEMRPNNETNLSDMLMHLIHLGRRDGHSAHSLLHLHMTSWSTARQ